MGLIIFIVFALCLVGLYIWWYLKSKKPNPPTPTPEPDPSSGDTLDTGDTPSSGDTIDSGDTPSSGDTPIDSGETPSSGETPDSGDTEPIDTGDTIDSGNTEPPCIAESETHGIEESLPCTASSERINVGWYDTDKICDGQWSVIGYDGDNFLSDIKFEDGNITAIIFDNNYGKERTTRYITYLSGKDTSKDDSFTVKQASSIDDNFDKIIDAFKNEAYVPKDGIAYNYLKVLYDEAVAQYYNGKSVNGIPVLYKEENFPNVYNFYGSVDNQEAAFNSFVGWLFSLVLAELKPKRRKYLFKIGYELGGYDRYSDIYGYTFKSDPTVARLVASALYVTMRGTKNPNVDAMRVEVGGSKYNDTLYNLRKTDKEAVGNDDFYTDFRKFMPTAPGPYAPGYTTRPDDTYPSEKKDEYKNIDVDRKLHEHVVNTFNLDNPQYSAMTVQAIADEEACTSHLFGDDITVGDYKFHPVFGIDTIGKRINDNGSVADFVYESLKTSSSSRTILQSKNTDPKQYGRLRPGCSWTQEAVKNSKSDDRRNALCEIDIEDNDGCKDSTSFGYYTADNQWVYTQAEEDAFCEQQKNSLYANSYPSGHSSGIWGAAMVLMELLPQLADKIMKEANQFAVNRTIARYHWNSDTLNGRLLGGATNAVAHAASDYDALLQQSKKELDGEIPTPEPTPTPDKIGTFTYNFGGSECSCSASEGVKDCERKACRYRSPIMKVSETVNYKIETDGYDVSVNGPHGSTSGVFNANTEYVIYCAKLDAAQEKIAKITLSNSSGSKIINYRLYCPNFEVNYKNGRNVAISNITCTVVFDNNETILSTYEWPISPSKEKSDSWIDLKHNSIKSITDVKINDKAVDYEVSNLNTKSVTITIK